MNRKIVFLISIGAAAVLAAALILCMQPGKLKMLVQTEHFEVFCADNDVQSAEAVAGILENNYGKITSDLDAEPSEKCRLMIYPDIDSFHKAIGYDDAPDWLAGTADGNTLHMVSPANPGSAHSYGDIMFVAVHEFVHIVVDEINSEVPVFLNEGVAAYEAGQSSGVMARVQQALTNDTFPTVKELETLSPDNGLYQFAYAFVDYIIDTYGMEKLTEFIRTPSVEAVFGVSEEDLSSAWRQSYI